MNFAGIDLGTSGVKVVLVDATNQILAEANAPITTSRPAPGWSEQHPDAWTRAIEQCFTHLHTSAPQALAGVAAIGLSGHMLGPVLINQADQPVRATLLWNDERATTECHTLLQRVPDLGYRANGIPDPGMGAPKLLWLAQHEPEVLEQTDCLLLPKDYVRLWLTGERASEPSDAAGLMLMDCATGTWDPALCEAAGWSLNQLPPLVPSWAPAGGLRPELAQRWGMTAGLPVAAGGGDNMVGALGAGVTRPSDTIVSLGTSAVTCIVDATFRPAPEIAVMTSAHVVPEAFLSMGVVMSATASVDWLSQLTQTPVATLAEEAEALTERLTQEALPVMRPNFNGIRTPYLQPGARGVLAGISLSTNRAHLMWSVMEGVAFQVYECLRAQQEHDLTLGEIRFVGGGARNLLWGKMIASLLNRPLVLAQHREVAAALGAVRLAQAAAGAALESTLHAKPAAEQVLEPEAPLQHYLLERLQQFEALPRDLASL